MNVVALVTEAEVALALGRWARRVARAVEGQVTILWLPAAGVERGTVLEAGAEMPEGLSRDLATLLEAIAPADRPGIDEADPSSPDEGVPPPLADPSVTVRILHRARAYAQVIDCLSEVDARYLLMSKSEERRPQDALVRRLLDGSPANTVVLRLGESSGESCERVMVVATATPHTDVNFRLADALAHAEGAAWTALFVEPLAGAEAEEVGAKVLEKALSSAGVAQSESVDRRVVLADDPLRAAREVAAEGFDLVLLDSSLSRSARALLFGAFPQSQFRDRPTLAVGTIRARFGVLDRFRQRLGRFLDLTVPQMSREERVGVYERLQSGSEWNFDFVTLITLSTAIAAIGLIQDSGAVVIGAMLVAPLMTPILGAGLALVQGNLPLVRSSLKALGLGYLCALLIGVAVGLVVGPPALTGQLLARGGPTLLDMGVGFLSGLAAAYCVGRPTLMAALPGVAIAAALVPPIATTGISASMGEWPNAAGAALLFLTNVVAIIVGAAFSLFGGGIRGRSGASASQRWVRVAFVVLVMLIGALAVPLGSGFKRAVAGHHQVLTARVIDALPADRTDELELRQVSRAGRSLYEVRLRSPAPVTREQAEAVAAAVRSVVRHGATVRLLTELATEVRSVADPPMDDDPGPSE